MNFLFFLKKKMIFFTNDCYNTEFIKDAVILVIHEEQKAFFIIINYNNPGTIT